MVGDTYLIKVTLTVDNATTIADATVHVEHSLRDYNRAQINSGRSARVNLTSVDSAKLDNGK